MKTTLPTAEQLRLDWTNNPRWAGIDPPVLAPRTWCACAAPSPIEHSLARLGADKLWR